MALPASFLDDLRLRTPLPALIGRRVKLARSGRQWKGCCPFHTEKTPSFYVYDDGFHCFGCGAHGDAISFVMQTEGAAFMEAVAQLAAAAGIEVPKPSPQAAEAERRRLELGEILDRAAAAFQRRLVLPEGARALGYLRERGLSEATIRRFGIGYSPGRGALIGELAREGIAPDRLAEAGLLAAGVEGGPRELFFERVTFPIRDRRGRIVAFGGRTLGEGQPKYLNGPETALFSKRRSVYGLDFARRAIGEGAAAVVVEGYMDVIALHQAGFGGAVAPLGTALTVEQLQILWQLAPEPVLCFDGDAAGARAAARAAELALPLLTPEQSLAFATLPDGEDPDTLVRRRGAAAFEAVLANRRPLAHALFDLLREASPGARSGGAQTGGAQSTPEARAAFRHRLEAAAARIPDRALAREYRRALLDRFFAELRTAGGHRWAGAVGREVRNSALPRPVLTSPKPGGTEQVRILTAILLHHPGLLAQVAEQYEALDLPAELDRLRAAILASADAAEILDSDELVNHLTRAGLEAEVRRARAATPIPLPACASRTAMPAEAAAGWQYYFELLHRHRLDAEIAEAEQALARDMNERTQQRLKLLREEQAKLRQGEPDGPGVLA